MANPMNSQTPAPSPAPRDQPPSAELFFRTANAYQQTAALKGALDLDVFTTIAQGKRTAAEMAKECQASERGLRILCDYLCVLGFLTKEGRRYSLTPDSATFLDRHSPAYMGGTLDFLLSSHLTNGFTDVAAFGAPWRHVANGRSNAGAGAPGLGDVRTRHDTHDGDAGTVDGPARER